MAKFSLSMTIQKQSQFQKIVSQDVVEIDFSSKNNQDMKELVKKISNTLSEPNTHCTLIFSPLAFFDFSVTEKMDLHCKYIDHSGSETFESGSKTQSKERVYMESMGFETFRCQYTGNSVIEQFIIQHISK